MFQSSWGQTAQNQQNNQQTPSAFGQPSGFGAQTGTGVFGQPQQQNNTFGNPLNTGTVAPASTFGAQPAQNAFSSSTAFGGAVKPATGFGAFGGTGTSTFGGGGAFSGGNNAAGSSIFGNQASTSTPSAFGSANTANAFGVAKSATGFGAASDGSYAQVPPVTTGTSNPPFEIFKEKESTGNAGSMIQYQNIAAMPAYRGCAPEELRVQDYLQGRKTAGTSAGAFGQSAFGAPATTSAFGAAQPQASTSAFGGNAFGSTAAAQPTNAFGAGGVFGQPAASGFGAFGQTQPQPATGFGAFGQTPAAAPAANTGLFGGSSTGASLFGQPKPATTGFGTTTTAFGGGSGANSTPNMFGAFGQNSAATSTPSAFGNTNVSNGAFGGAFGNNNAVKPPIFGTQPATAPSNTLFGSSTVNQTTQPASNLFGGGIGGIFGQNTAVPAQPSLFGQGAAAAPQPAASTFGGGLFSGTQNAGQQAVSQQPAPTSIFGNFGDKSSSQAGQGGGIFGNSAFGSNTAVNNNTSAAAAGGNIFGAPNNNSSNNAFSGFGGGSLFGNKPVAPAQGTGGVFGNGAGLFGASSPANTQSQQGNLTASVAQPIGTNLPIFSMLPQGPRAVPIEIQKKKPGFFVDVPTRSPVPRVGLGYTPASSKLRGFSDSVTSNSNPHALSLSRSGTPDLFIGRAGSPSLGSGARQSVKKLVLDKKNESPGKVHHNTNASPVTRQRTNNLFSPALGQAARESEAVAAAAAASASAVSSSRTNLSPPPVQRPNAFTANGADVSGGSEELQKGDYWVKPDLETLIHKGYDELVACTGLIVGRVGYGEVRFLEPVDLTGLSRLGALKGGVVRFDDKTCSVYPDSEDVDKPLAGNGLNVKARIVLVRCWAVNRATREPIMDETDPAAVKHLKKLKAMKGTHFEEFDHKDGKWVFTVDHF